MIVWLNISLIFKKNFSAKFDSRLEKNSLKFATDSNKWDFSLEAIMKQFFSTQLSPIL
jgi:hypothetical protein